MGAEAVATVTDHQQAISTLGNALHKAQSDLTALAVDHAIVKSDVGAVIDQAGWAVAACKDLGRARDVLEDDLRLFKAETRELRKRHEIDHYVQSEAADATRALLRLVSEPLHRGFLGRLRWLFTGK